ncbi:probable xyloglucan endotransglucosylase/hydrolase protein 27 isoform X2 [Vicia villosa]|uniref:probable xyloglucan endotransglucosylase/hydrolase protein 27 isoform X2 n=1 Tax=Vicia villosa TaxID=3911 RepID=UPI00273A7EEB|nr:probable xyloglucan endotransglucosylase/hydrolase protein 27 isoform X2 [Vicia villosa]
MSLHFGFRNVHVCIFGFDVFSGFGFASQDIYLHGYFSASIKLPSDYTAGIVVAFYVNLFSENTCRLRRQHLKKKEEEEMALLTFSAVAGLKPPCDADGYHPVLYIEFQRDQENERIEAKESHIMEIQINGGTIAQKKKKIDRKKR